MHAYVERKCHLSSALSPLASLISPLASLLLPLFSLLSALGSLLPALSSLSSRRCSSTALTSLIRVGD